MSKSSKKHPDPAFTPRKRRKGKGKKKRRTFTRQFKLEILRELDELEETGDGQVGEVLRREGLYSSHITKWRRLRDAGELSETKAPRRGRKADEAKAEKAELARLKAELTRAQKKLAQAEALIEVQKKLYTLFHSEEESSEMKP